MDKYLPADSILVIKVNVREILDSRLAKDYWAAGLRQYWKDYPETQAFFKDVGFDLFKALDQVIVTGPGDDAPTEGLAIFKGRFDPTKIHAKVKALIQSQADLGKILQEPDGKGGDFPNLPGMAGIARFPLYRPAGLDHPVPRGRQGRHP